MLQFDALGQLHQCHAAVHSVNIEDCEVRNDSADTSDRRLRQLAFLDDLGLAVLVEVIGNDDDLCNCVRSVA